MSWTPVQFGKLFSVKHGYAFKGAFFDNAGPYVLLTPGNFNEGGGFRNVGEKQRHYTGDVPDGFILDEGDVLVAMTEQVAGLLGSTIWISASDRYLHNQRLGRIIDLDESRIDRRYLYHLFNTPDVRNQISASASGTKVRHTAPERIGRVQIYLPSVPCQRKIADAITAYDDLIENNRRRMALLEESARLLYREWFVRLRFPGHEHVPVVNGVPEGWEQKTLGELVTLNYGKALKADDRTGGPFPVFGSSGIVGTHSKALVTGPGIVLGRKGNVGSVYWSSQDFYAIDTVYFIEALASNLYLYHVLKNMHFLSTDVAVPGLNRDFAYSRRMLLPSSLILRQFLEMTEPMQRQLDCLERGNQKLRTARDLLLPRLMSGEIAV